MTYLVALSNMRVYFSVWGQRLNLEVGLSWNINVSGGDGRNEAEKAREGKSCLLSGVSSGAIEIYWEFNFCLPEPGRKSN